MSLVLIPGFAQLPEFEWASQCGNPPNTTETRSSLAACSDGTFYMSGEFRDTAQFGNKSLVSAGGTDVFLVRHSETGEPVWTVRIGGTNDEYIHEVMCDEEGNAVVAGYFYGNTQIGPDNYTSYGSQDLFVAKINAAGNFLWSFRAGGPMADFITALALDNEQNITISGYFYDQISFGDTTLANAQGSDIFTARMSADGDLLWVVAAGGSSSDQVFSADCDANGNVLIAGSYYYNFTIGDTTLTTDNPVGVFVARFLPGGQFDQVFQLNGSYLTPEIHVIAAPSGNFYIAGNFSETITFGAKMFKAGEFNQDIYIARYDATMKLAWARHAHSYSSDQVVDIETDSYDNLFLTGHYLDSIHFDEVVLPYTLCCGSREIFIVSYNASGSILWGKQISGTRANIHSISLNQQDELLLSGLFTEEMILGNLSLSNFDGFRNYYTCLRTEIYTATADNLLIPVLRVFPNPVRDQMRITGPGIERSYNFFIYSQSGMMIMSGRLEENGHIETASLPQGAYILQLSGMDGKQFRSCMFIRQ